MHTLTYPLPEQGFQIWRKVMYSAEQNSYRWNLSIQFQERADHASYMKRHRSLRVKLLWWLVSLLESKNRTLVNVTSSDERKLLGSWANASPLITLFQSENSDQTDVRHIWYIHHVLGPISRNWSSWWKSRLHCNCTFAKQAYFPVTRSTAASAWCYWVVPGPCLPRAPPVKNCASWFPCITPVKLYFCKRRACS